MSTAYRIATPLALPVGSTAGLVSPLVDGPRGAELPTTPEVFPMGFTA